MCKWEKLSHRGRRVTEIEKISRKAVNIAHRHTTNIIYGLLAVVARGLEKNYPLLIDLEN